jgi:flagellar biosynthesis GTPase FlhF
VTGYVTGGAEDGGAGVSKVMEAEKALEQAKANMQERRTDLEVQRRHLERVREGVASLVDPDTSAIDAEIAAAREQNAAARRATEEHNRQVRAAQQQAAEVKRAQAERERLERQAAERETAAKKLTERIEQLDAEKAARLAAAALPIPGIALAGDVVTFDDGKAGPVELEALNTASRIRLDVAIAAALGHRLVAVRDASLLDAEERAAVDAFAAERGVQLLAEVVVSGEPLSAVIEEAAPLDPAVQAELGDF